MTSQTSSSLQVLASKPALAATSPPKAAAGGSWRMVLAMALSGTIGLLGASAMAGYVGGGGIGDLALTYGYQKFNTPLMIFTVVILIIVVQLLQALGNGLSRRLREHTQQALLSSQLATIACDAPLPEDIADGERRAGNPAVLDDLLEHARFGPLTRRRATALVHSA